MQRQDTVWQSAALTQSYLEGVRGAIPLAREQLDVMLRIAGAACPNTSRFLDLGCGDGVLAAALLNRFPRSNGVLLDFSAPMLAHARERLAQHLRRITLIEADYGVPRWIADVREHVPFDLIVSGFSIHHQPDARKQALYLELFEMLAPGGVFLNIEHVASPTLWVSTLHDDLFIDALLSFAAGDDSPADRAHVAAEYDARPDKSANLLAPVELQCAWLREIGFTDVDCFLKIFELALFGGRRPERRAGL